MSDYVEVNSNAIKNDADRVNELIGSIPTLVKELEQSLYTLDGCWEGAAWNEYQNTNAYYMEVLADIYKYYGEFTAELHKASQIYMRTEQDVMDDVDSWSF